MPTTNLGLSNSLALGAEVSASEANRVHNVLDTQLFGALGAIGSGIVENADGDSLSVSAGTGLEVQVSAGEAIVLSPARLGRAPHAVWGVLAGVETVPVAPDATQYICARLVLSIRRSDPDCEEGTASLEAVALDSDSIPGTLLLATVQSSGASITSVVDANFYTKPDVALKSVLTLLADVGYNAEERARGTVAARLDVLEGRGDGGGGGTDGGGGGDGGGGTDGGAGVTRAEFLVLKAALKQLRDDFEAFRASAHDDSVVGVSEVSSALLVNSGKLMANMVNLDPSSARHFLAGIDMPDATGDAQRIGSLTQGTVRLGGSAYYDEEEGTIHG